MDPIVVTLVVLLAAVVLFVWNRLPVELVAIGVALALVVTGVLSAEQTLAGFGDPVIVFIAALFVVSEALDATGVTTWAGQQLVRRAGTRRWRIVTLVMVLVALVTALISVNGAVAALLPMVVVLAMRIGEPPSQLLMPLAFGAHAGSLLVLTGTPVNVLIAELAVSAGQRPIGFFEFGLVGVPLVVGTILVTVLLGPKLLPKRAAKLAPRDLSEHAHTLAAQYSLDDPESLFSREKGVTEIVVPPRSSFVGATVFTGMVTSSGQLVVIAIQRAGEDLTEATLVAGDVMLLRGTWDALDKNSADPGVVVVDSPQSVRRQAVPMGPRARTALVVLLGMVILLATGIVPAALAALAAAAAMVLFRVLTIGQAHRAISWTTLILVGGMIPLSTAIQVSGAADLIAGGLVSAVGGASPYLLVLGIAGVTVVLGQLISNMATALIIAPIAIAIAGETGISPLPLLMAVAVAAAASFLTPVATPANTMVLGPGAYRFGDYWKLGLPLVVLFLLVATLLVPVFWPFH
ncbi:SLC13/DASS family transporter [Cryobacterium algoricola]|uniref:SLC13/DASS family transporter n=1 Tax=Cryobacterium algoricola TaxID=1259183 RepID=A0ABY2IFZ9_9MICO|nr:SLC13 family permease [Cryobacterium algoricola]TFB87553.1 SLC13/DASS family transporter [Cryobacterium algoricola]